VPVIELRMIINLIKFGANVNPYFDVITRNFSTGSKTGLSPDRRMKFQGESDAEARLKPRRCQLQRFEIKRRRHNVARQNPA